MSSNNGKAPFNLIAARVAGISTFYPAYRTAAGKDVSQRLRLPMAINSRQGKVSYFDAIAWGKRTVLAFYAQKGKELHLDGHLTSDMVAVRDNQGNIVMQSATGREKDENGNPYAIGQQIPIRVPRVSLVVEGWIFGDDSAEVKSRRPQGWDVPGTPGNVQWKQLQEQIKAAAALPYQGGDTYGFAKVGAVNGTPMSEDANGNLVALQGVAGANTGLFQNPGMAGAGAAVPPPPGGDANMQLLTALRTAGWKDEQIKSRPEYQHLVPLMSSGAVPPPPNSGLFTTPNQNAGYAGAPMGV